jgi:P-type E1-E2 ATPase
VLRFVGVLGIADEVKQNAVRAVKALRALGLRVFMLSGDNERATARVAAAVRIDEWRAGVRPEDKLALVRELQAQGLRSRWRATASTTRRHSCKRTSASP